MLSFQITLCGKVENTSAITEAVWSLMSPRIDPKETSTTPSSPDPLTNCSNSSESGLAGLDRNGPTSLVSASIKKMTPSCQCE